MLTWLDPLLIPVLFVLNINKPASWLLDEEWGFLLWIFGCLTLPIWLVVGLWRLLIIIIHDTLLLTYHICSFAWRVVMRIDRWSRE